MDAVQELINAVPINYHVIEEYADGIKVAIEMPVD